MTFYARVQDPDGQENGINGYVVQVVEAANLTALEAQTGPDYIGYYVVTTDPLVTGWKYEDGKFIDPKGK
jgi:hypothetical protein